MFRIAEASHVFVHPMYLERVIKMLGLVGISRDEARRRVVLLCGRDTPSSAVAAEGWLTVEGLSITDASDFTPEDFSGERAHETALLFTTCGK